MLCVFIADTYIAIGLYSRQTTGSIYTVDSCGASVSLTCVSVIVLHFKLYPRSFLLDLVQGKNMS